MKSIVLISVVMWATLIPFGSTSAFQPVLTGNRVKPSQLNVLPNNMDKSDDTNGLSGRREMFASTIGAVLSGIVAVSTINVESAGATYSAYSNREKDWQERLANGDVQVKSARDLRRQLAEIAPMNNEGSKIFCPNGPSANVSPLMENKCNDRLAIPSVYGRTEDAVGNSIPGFNGGFYGSSGGGPPSSSLAAELGSVGYGFTASGQRK